MIKKAFVVIGIFLIIGFISSGLKSCKDGRKETTQTESSETSPPSQASVIPCMCNESDLVFHHAVSDVRLSKNEKYTWKRPHGYEVRWCAYGGKSGSEKVQQLTRNNQPEMTLQALEDNVLVMVRYYVKKH